MSLLVKHLRFWGKAVAALVDEEVVVDLTVIDDAALGERIQDTVQPQLPGLHLRDAPRRTTGIGYYRSAAFKIILCSATAMNQNSEMAASPLGQPLLQPTPKSDA